MEGLSKLKLEYKKISKALKLDSKNVYLYYERGKVNIELKNYLAAMDDLSKSLNGDRKRSKDLFRFQAVFLKDIASLFFNKEQDWNYIYYPERIKRKIELPTVYLKFINAFVSALDREFERSLSFFEDVIIQDKKVFEENKFLINNQPLEMQLLLKIRIY